MWTPGAAPVAFCVSTPNNSWQFSRTYTQAQRLARGLNPFERRNLIQPYGVGATAEKDTIAKVLASTYEVSVGGDFLLGYGLSR